mgnify:CR=1 FL=1
MNTYHASVDAERPATKSRRDVLVDIGDGSLPLYKSIKLELVRAIGSGGIQAGRALPTEKELSDHYGVSVGAHSTDGGQ